jgi:hypothetical protein
MRHAHAYTTVAAALAAAICALPSAARADEPAAPPVAAPGPSLVAPAPAAIPAPTAKPESGKTVTVELQSNDEHATIERRLGTTQLAGLPFVDTSFSAVGHWEESCVAPCELKLDPHYSYRVAGDGLTPTRSFALPRDKDRVRLSAEMGSSSGRLAGVVLTSIGAGTAFLGGAALIASPILESQDVGSKGFRSIVLAGGAIFLAAGVLEMGMGLYLWATNGSSVRADHGVLSAAGSAKKTGGVKVTPVGLVF